jgi:hypothetical protein
VPQNQRSIPLARVLPEADLTSSWRRYFEKAIRESDPVKLLALIHETEKALLFRGIEMGCNESHEVEREAMGSACNDLGVIKVLKLGWPDLSE